MNGLTLFEIACLLLMMGGMEFAGPQEQEHREAHTEWARPCQFDFSEAEACVGNARTTMPMQPTQRHALPNPLS